MLPGNMKKGGCYMFHEIEMHCYACSNLFWVDDNEEYDLIDLDYQGRVCQECKLFILTEETIII